LEELIAAAHPEICPMSAPDLCRTHASLRASVRAGRVVLSLRDSALIESLFALRPSNVIVSRERPELPVAEAWNGVRIAYVSPYLPKDGAALAAARRRREAQEWETFHVLRGLWMGSEKDGWLVVGDSAPLFVTEQQCSTHWCFRSPRRLLHSEWRLSDKRVARLRPAGPHDKRDPADRLGPRPDMIVRALRPGTTTISVRVSGSLDAAPGAKRSLEQVLRVTLPIASLTIASAPDTVRVGEEFTLGARVLDTRGKVEAELPVKFRIIDPGFSHHTTFDGKMPIRMITPGRVRIVAALGEFADTTLLTVVESMTTR
jgi:hypothetical protein